MENNQEMLELLERIEKANRKQILLARVQVMFAVTAALCCVLLLLAGLRVLPQLQQAAVHAETVLENLETVTSELAQSDLNGMVSNVDALVTTTQAGVEDTMQKLNAIDFDALNKAIEDLSDVIEPIAKFFNTFKLG